MTLLQEAIGIPRPSRPPYTSYTNTASQQYWAKPLQRELYLLKILAIRNKSETIRPMIKSNERQKNASIVIRKVTQRLIVQKASRNMAKKKRWQYVQI